MIKSTLKLIEYLQTDKDKRESSIVHSHVISILKLGSKEDAKLLLDCYLNNPFDFDHSYLLSLFTKFGDTEFAEKIFHKVITNNRLDENADPEVLTLLGDLKYEPIKKLLYHYGFSKITPDYYLQTYSILGLLNFDCTEYLEEIRVNIDGCLNNNLFPELIPALVCKLPERQNVLEQLYELGENFASTDCNGGIILGFSLCGKEGEKHFKKALFNPNWETYSASTGTLGYTYKAMKNLGITFSELYSEVKNRQNKAELEYSLRVLFSLFEKRILDYEDENMESFKDLFHTFFSWESPNTSNNLIDLAKEVGIEGEAYKYESLFKSKITEEIILDNFNP